jgi:hypothetical protein
MAQDRRPPAPKAKPKATEGHVVCETVADALAFLERTEYWACPFCGTWPTTRTRCPRTSSGCTPSGRS